MKLKDWPIRKKIIFLLVSISGSATLFATIIFAFLEVSILKQQMVDNLSVLSSALAKNSTAALSFRDSRTANELLRGLSADTDIVAGVILDAKDNLFAHYGISVDMSEFVHRGHSKQGHEFVFEYGTAWLDVYRPILIGKRVIGTLYVRATIDKLINYVEYCAIVLVLTLILVMGIVYGVSRKLQKIILQPVSWLANVARDISQSGDYTLRVPKRSNDEIGYLVDDFNTMLNVIQERDKELNDHRNQLESLVEERTWELKLKRDEAVASAKAKGQFLANMSHEIRTPMNGVIGMLSLLEAGKLDSVQKEFLVAASNSANALMTIINDILDYSKIEAGKIQFEKIEFDLRYLMEDVATLFARTATDKNLDLACFVPNELHGSVKGDPTRLRQILSNLLSNGLKFTETGEVVLSVVEESCDDEHVALRFSIKDTGPGIDENKIDSIFLSFTQADGSTTRRHGGSGLGLTVTKQLIELMDGTIGVTTEKGVGTEFWFNLELECGSAPPVSYPDKYNFRGAKILVVDDNQTNCVILQQYLKPLEVEVISCSSAIEALGEIVDAESSQCLFDLVLLDYHMPRKDGLQLARQIHEDPAITTPYMVMLSSGDISLDIARQVGIKAHLLKPFRQAQLYEILGQYSRKERAISKINKETIIQQMLGHVLVVDDEQVNGMVACAMLDTFGVESTVAVNGEHAVTLIKQNNYDLILMDCHMPIMNGYDASKAIRQFESQHNKERTPIIAMTANVMQGARDECLEAGMDEYMSKPISKKVLGEVLIKWLNVKTHDKTAELLVCSQEDELANKSDELFVFGKEDKAPIWDRLMVLKQLGNDEQILEELIEIFKNRCPEQMRSILKAINENDADALLEAAHAYKGSVGHFFALEIKEIALELENKAKTNDLYGVHELYSKLEMKTNHLLDALEI